MRLLPRIRDLYDVIIPVFILSKFLGLAPFYFEQNRTRCFKPHWGFFVLIRFVFVIGTMGYVSTLLYDPSATINIGWIALQCELYFGATVTSIILTLAVTNQRMVIKAIEKIMKIDCDLMKIGINISYQNAQRFAYFQMIGITLVFSSKLILQPFSVKKLYVFVYNVFNVVDYINTIMLFQYVDILLLLRQRYIWINKEIRNKGDDKRFSKDIKFIKCYDKVHGKEVNYPTQPLFENFIDSIAKIHSDMYHTAILINRSYGIQLLTTICARFVMITTQLINTYKTIQTPNKGDAMQYIIFGIYLFLHISKIFMVASISENTSAKARETGLFIHKLWNTNRNLKEKINSFSLHILHQKLKFSAAGFFILDYTLIHSIFGAVTTYFIISIQLDSNQQRQDNT